MLFGFIFTEQFIIFKNLKAMIIQCYFIAFFNYGRKFIYG